MAIECAFSFRDLFIAAYGREPDGRELQLLYALSQEERNKTVKRWAKKADWEVTERTGSDGVTYLAFAPNFREPVK